MQLAPSFVQVNTPAEVGSPPPQVDTSATLLAYPEAARRVGVCQRTLWDAVSRGELVCVRIGRRVLFDPTDLAAWVYRQKSSAPQADRSVGEKEGA